MSAKMSKRSSSQAELLARIADLERRLAEAQAASASAQAEVLNAAIEAMPDAVLIFGREGWPTRVNASTIQATGFDPTGLPLDEILRRLEFRHPDGRPATRADVPSAQALAGYKVMGAHFRITGAGGREISIQVNAAPINIGGQMAGAAVVWRDITALEHDRAALQASEARERQRAQELEIILDTIPAYVWITHDPDSRVMTGNQQTYALVRMETGANVSKTAAGVAETRHFRVLRHGVEVPPQELPMQQAARGVIIHNYEMEMSFEDGESLHLAGNATPLFDEHGEPAGAVGVFLDITQRKLAEQALQGYAAQLENSNRELEEFAYVASHDLQEPLRKIEAFANALLAGADNLEEPQRDALRRMSNSARRLHRMVEGLLELARITTRGQSFGPVDLAGLAAEIVTDLEGQILRTHGQVVLEPLPVVEGDPLQLRRLLQNLIGNALKYHRPGEPPVVRVASRPAAPGTVELSVEDNGIGFDERYAEQIFQPFRRLVGKSEYDGTGLGLAICRRIVERHGGSIRAHSSPGQGATFSVALPLRHSGLKTR